MGKKRILFVYEIEDESLWHDGLWAAIELLKKDFEIEKYNLAKSDISPQSTSYDFILGWGAFGSKLDEVISKNYNNNHWKRGLLLAGNVVPVPTVCNYDVIFYETEWIKNNYLQNISKDCKLIHAFGVNTNIYYSMSNFLTHLWDYITVGSFSKWKRQEMLLDKKGNRLAVGQIQKNNLSESIDIVGNLILGGVAISDSVTPSNLAKIYNLAKTVYIPADIYGGGERAVLEARACGVNVEVADDNPKLKELLTSPIWNHTYYAKQIKKGINLCLS